MCNSYACVRLMSAAVVLDIYLVLSPSILPPSPLHPNFHGTAKMGHVRVGINKKIWSPNFQKKIQVNFDEFRLTERFPVNWLIG